MRTLTLEEINQLQHGELIPRFTGRITKVFDQKTGEGERGPWHLQTFMLAQGQNEISVTWTGEDSLLNEWEGQLVAIECSENSRTNMLSGVKRDVRVDKNGKEWRGVKITPACKIRRLDNGEPTAKGEHFDNSDAIAAMKAADKEVMQKPKLKPIGVQTEISPLNTVLPKPKPNGDKIHAYAAHSARVFMIAWDKAKEVMAAIPSKDGEEMSAYEWNDLRIRIAQNFAIEINKIIRKERF